VESFCRFSSAYGLADNRILQTNPTTTTKQQTTPATTNDDMLSSDASSVGTSSSMPSSSVITEDESRKKLLALRGTAAAVARPMQQRRGSSGNTIPLAANQLRSYNSLSRNNTTSNSDSNSNNNNSNHNSEDDSYDYENKYDQPSNQITQKSFYFGIDVGVVEQEEQEGRQGIGSERERGRGVEALQKESRRPLWVELISLFCPCLINPLREDRRQEFKIASKTFCVIVALIQFILMLVAIGKGGIHPRANPSLGPDAADLAALGMKISYCIGHSGEWRIFSSIFLHAGLLHLFSNLYIQLRVGIFLERTWKWSKLSAIYFVSGLGGGLISCVFRPTRISVDASGAVMGLMGAYLVEIILTWHRTEEQKRRLSLVVCLFAIAFETAIGFLPFLDVSCHLGGLLLGVLLGLYCFIDEADHRFVKAVVPKISIVLIVAVFVVSIILFVVLGVANSDAAHASLCDTDYRLINTTTTFVQ